MLHIAPPQTAIGPSPLAASAWREPWLPYLFYWFNRESSVQGIKIINRKYHSEKTNLEVLKLHKNILMIIMAIGICGNTSFSDTSIGLYSAGSEVYVRNLDMTESKALIEGGFNFHLSAKYWQLNSKIGYGQLNFDNTYTGSIGLGPIYPLFHNTFDLHMELGLSYFGYVKQTYFSNNSIKEKFTNNFPIYYGLGSTIMGRATIFLSTYINSDILWKISVGYQIYKF